MPAPDLREPIRAALAAFAAQPLPAAAGTFFRILGYSSDRTLSMGSIRDFCSTYDSDGSRLSKFKPSQTWRSLDLLFQLTSADIARGTSQQLSLLEAEPADLRQIESYLFFALELNPADDGKLRSRSELADVARAINRLFPMPALLLFKEGDKLSIAITYRRGSKKDRSKDVVERKVTLIKDISITRPHPGHIAIVQDFALPTLSEFRGRDIRTFADLDNAWRESLSVELLRRRAYRMLADWYFWAREHAKFPPDAPLDAEGKPSLHLIRLLTRIIFCWFVKEKTLPDGRPLIPYSLFDPPRIREILKDAAPDSCTYYTAILQNLFFATARLQGTHKPQHRCPGLDPMAARISVTQIFRDRPGHRAEG